ncbi:MAG: hypothetical protein KDC98_00100 [Planctomycetes bacterium]|nr:hypothetical protein [Planctomycetota bacterium]
MGIKEDATKALDEFETANPALAGKAYLTSGSRTWQEQLDIILDPKRKANYPNIKKRFTTKFSLDRLPQARKDLTKEQLAWWKAAIMKQAGKSPGFPHVGGKAQDISVKQLDKKAKADFKKILDDNKVKVLMEFVTSKDSQYGVSIGKANVFHVYK